MISCLHCAEPTDNHAICDKCFAAANKRHVTALQQRAALKGCPVCGSYEHFAIGRIGVPEWTRCRCGQEYDRRTGEEWCDEA